MPHQCYQCWTLACAWSDRPREQRVLALVGERDAEPLGEVPLLQALAEEQGTVEVATVEEGVDGVTAELRRCDSHQPPHGI